MLIRVVSHHKNNSNHIDKMIRIDGLPDDILFRKKDGRTFLLSPWEPDATVNIPKDIRAEHCQKMVISFQYPPLEKGQGPFIDEQEVYGLKIDYQSGPGKEVWDRVERMIEDETPRSERLPEPIVVAPDQKSAFSVESADIPVVLLTKQRKADVKPVILVPKVMDTVPQTYECPCGKSFEKPRGLEMHRRKTGHKEPVTVGA